MDIEKISVVYVKASKNKISEDGYTQHGKILPWLSIAYPYTGHFEVYRNNDPHSYLANGTGCYIAPAQTSHTIVHHLGEGESEMQ